MVSGTIVTLAYVFRLADMGVVHPVGVREKIRFIVEQPDYWRHGSIADAADPSPLAGDDVGNCHH